MFVLQRVINASCPKYALRALYLDKNTNFILNGEKVFIASETFHDLTSHFF